MFITKLLKISLLTLLFSTSQSFACIGAGQYQILSTLNGKDYPVVLDAYSFYKCKADAKRSKKDQHCVIKLYIADKNGKEVTEIFKSTFRNRTPRLAKSFWEIQTNALEEKIGFYSQAKTYNYGEDSKVDGRNELDLKLGLSMKGGRLFVDLEVLKESKDLTTLIINVAHQPTDSTTEKKEIKIRNGLSPKSFGCGENLDNHL